MVIRHIDPECRNQIVSGSLIPGPVSAIKELIDNAIDSGAKNIYLDIDQGTGGCEYIRVRDDGSGVEAASRPLMCLNYSTSKISSLQEIAQVSTLGFRGQALFTLASLSNARGHMEVSTKCKEDIVGEKWIVEGNGSIKGSKTMKIPCLQGTTVIVRKLLAGLRARYLESSKKPFKQIGRCKALIDHYSLEYRSIRFHFYLDSLDKNGLVVKRELQQSHDTKFSKVTILSLIARLNDTRGHNLMELKGILIDRFTRIDAILPRMIPNNDDILNVRKPKKFLSFNGRPLSLERAFGKGINRMVDSLYRQLQAPAPMVWYMNLHTDMKIADVNIEPEKNDILIKDVDFLLVKLKQALLSHLSQELNTKFHGGSTLTAEQPTTRDSPCKINRSLTIGSMVSDEGEWSHTLLDDDDDDSNCQYRQDDMGDLPSSLTYNYKETSFENEDLEVSRGLSVSNPFMTAKLRRASNNRETKDVYNRKNSWQVKAREESINEQEPPVKTRRVNNITKDTPAEPAADLIFEDTTLVGIEEDQNDQKSIPERSIFNFSEFTNNYTVTKPFKISHYSSNTYDQENNWLSRGGYPSEWMIAYMKAHSEADLVGDVYLPKDQYRSKSAKSSGDSSEILKKLTNSKDKVTFLPTSEK